MDLMQVFWEAKKKLPVHSKTTPAPKIVANTETPKPAPKANPLNTTFKNTDFTERVAILIEAGGFSSIDAHQLAMAEMGGEGLDLWKSHINRQGVPANTEGRLILKTAIAFLESPMASMAAYYGWDDLEIFGALNGPPRAMVRRHDAMGLIPALAWSRIGSRLIDIEPDRAILKTHTGNTLIKNRKLTSYRLAVPVWWSGILQEVKSGFDHSSNTNRMPAQCTLSPYAVIGRQM